MKLKPYYQHYQAWQRIGKFTLRSLLNELARLTIVTIVKQASSFNRDLRVPCKGKHHQFNLFKPTFLIKAHFLIWSYQACNSSYKLVTCMATNLVLEKIKLHLYIVYTLKSTSYRPANCCHQSNLSEPNKYFWPKVGIWPKYYYSFWPKYSSSRSVPWAEVCLESECGAKEVLRSNWV